MPVRRRCFRGHAPPQGACENLVCAPKVVAHLQAGGENLVGTIFQGLPMRSRLKITSDERKFIHADSLEALKIGDLEQNSGVIKVVRPAPIRRFSRM